MSQTYNALNGVTTETFPDLDGVGYTYDEAGWLSAVSGYIDGPSCFPKCIKYNARGQKDEIDYNNGVKTTFDYFDNTSPTDFTNFALKTRFTTGPSGDLQNLSYTYDEVGNVLTVDDGIVNGTAGRTFGYDDLNRLTSASGRFGPLDPPNTGLPTQVDNQPYVYDAVGNILTKGTVTYQYCNHPLQPADPSLCTDTALHPSAVTRTFDSSTSTQKLYHYDNNGNTLDGAGRTFVWTADNRVDSVTLGSTTSMDYDYTGTRVKKTNGNAVTIYPFAGYEIEPNGTKIKFFRAGTELLAAKQTTSTGTDKKLFYHNDHLGGINVITDDDVNHNGAKQQLTEYDPWGKISRNEPSNNSVDPDHRFTGQIFDPESGLYYYGARYYDPELARFISPDPIVPSPGDPQSLNRYSYVRNNPVKYIDPTGHSFWSAIGNFFKNFFRSLPALITGLFVAWICPPAWGPVVAGILAGMAAGAVNAAVNGGNFGMSIGLGALFGGIAGGIGPPIFEGVGGVPSNGVAWSNFLPAVKAGVVVGAALGGLSTAFSRGNFFQNVAFGALGGGITAAGAFGAVKAWNAMTPSEAAETGGSAADSGGIQPRNPRPIAREVAGVQILFKPGADQPVDSVLADRFETAVAGAKVDNPELKTLTVSETVAPRTLHRYGFAIDVSRVNGSLMVEGYGSNSVVTNVVQSLQANLSALSPYENYGPSLMYGPAANNQAIIQQHTTHVHFSIKP
jgi:RHS repeat-associated protein